MPVWGDEKVSINKTSTPILQEESSQNIRKTVSGNALLRKLSSDSDKPLYKYLIEESYMKKGQLKSYYNYGKSGYYLGLPQGTCLGVNHNIPAIRNAIHDDLGLNSSTVVEVEAKSGVGIELGWKYLLQSSPWNYNPHSNTLTYNGKDDWNILSIGQDSDTDEFGTTHWHTLNLRRASKNVLYSLRGPRQVMKGSTVPFTVYCNHIMPEGIHTTVNMAYSGSASANTPHSSVMPQLSSSTELNIEFTPSVVYSGERHFTISIDSITDDENYFASTEVYQNSGSRTVTVRDNNPIPGHIAVLKISGQEVQEEGLEEIVIPITLSDNVGSSFTVDYSSLQAVPGHSPVPPTAFYNTSGTLTFQGNKDEVQYITIGWVGDVLDYEYIELTLELTNCSRSDITYFEDTVFSVVADTGPYIPIVEEPEELAPQINLGTGGSFDFNADYVVVRFHEGDADHNPELWYYWFYKVSTGTYPDVVPTYSLRNIDDMYPIGVIRKHKEFVDTDKESTEYTSCRTLLNRLLIDLDLVIEGVKEQEGYEELDDLFTIIAVTPSDDSPLVSKLLFKYFQHIIEELNPASIDEQYKITFTSQDLETVVAWNEHTIEYGIIEHGTIDSIGTYSHEIETVFEGYEENLMEEFGYPDVPIYGDWLVIRYQKSATTQDVVRIKNLNTVSRISYGNHTYYTTHGLVERTVAFVPIHGPQNMSLPLFESIVTDNFNYKEQMELYQHIARIDAHSIQITYLTWFQEHGPFIIKAISIISLVYSLGTSAAANSLWSFFIDLIVNTVILKVVTVVVKETGNEVLGAIVGTVLALVASSYGYGSNLEIGTAETLTETVTYFSNISSSVQQGTIAIEQQKLEEEIKEMEDLENTLQELEKNDIDLSEHLLLTPDTVITLGRDIQYNYDIMLSTGTVNRLVSNFFENALNLKV